MSYPGKIVFDILSNEKKMDWACLLLLILLNPVFYSLFSDSAYNQPDTFAYIAQAVNFLEHFQFHSGPHRHIDTSLILPPLYPLLIASISAFGVHELIAAVKISQVSGILFSVMAFFLMKNSLGKAGSLIALVAIQFTVFYFNFFNTALTESIFLFTLVTGLYVLNNSFNSNSRLLLCGVIAALIYFSRDIGLVFLIFAIVSIIIYGVIQSDLFRITTIQRILLLSAGFALLALPYSVAVFLQTDHLPFAKTFRLGEYSVVAEKKVLVDEVLDIRATVPSDYEDVRKKRRKLMQLLPDNSEMYNFVRFEEQETGVNTSYYSKIVSHIKQYSDNLKNNLKILHNILGPVLFYFLLALLVSNFMFFFRDRNIQRITLPVFIILYLLSLSIITSLVERYVSILIPIILIFMFMEFSYLTREVFSKYNTGQHNLSSIIPAFILTVLIMLLTNYFTTKPVYFPVTNLINNTEIMRSEVNGDPVFTHYPLYAYMVGGKFRLLPNDDLSSIREYGKYTGVKWLLVVKTSNVKDRTVESYWDQTSEWMNSNLQENDNLIYCCGWKDTQLGMVWRLFRIN